MKNMKQPGVGVGVMILKGRKILLGKRHYDPKKADSELHGEGNWTMPGGKVNFGETLKEAAIREIDEETGVNVSEKTLLLISVTDDILENVHFATIGFLCKSFPREPRVVEPNEITEWKWFDLNKLPTPIFFPSEKILENYRNTNQRRILTRNSFLKFPVRE